MAGRTHGEKIDGLMKAVAALETTTSNLGRALAGVDGRVIQLEKEHHALSVNIAVVKERATTIHEFQKRTTEQRWLLFVQIVGAIVTVALSALLSYLISRQ